MNISYTAKRNLIAGHVSGSVYNVECTPELLNPITNFNREQVTTLSGTQHFNLLNIDEGWKVKSAWIQSSDEQKKWKEFLHSVAGGETFSFDAYGTSASADNVQSVVLMSSDASPLRVGTTNIFQYDFEVKVQ